MILREKTNRNILGRIGKGWQLYLFILVPAISVLVFSYFPMYGVLLAFKKYDISLGIWNSPWIGFQNFYKFFNSYVFERIIGNTISLSLYDLAASFPVPIIFALMINSMKQPRYKNFIQTVTYLPYFISCVVMMGIVMQLVNPKVGAFGYLYTALTNSPAPDIMAKPNAFPHLYVWSDVWQNFGWCSIVYVAALSSVDSSYYEAAEIDGASRFKQVIYIDLPCIIPTAIMILILSAGKTMNVGFEKVFLLQNALNLRTSEVISTYVYKVGLTGMPDVGYGTAIGLFNSVVNLILIIIVNTISKKLSKQSIW